MALKLGKPPAGGASVVASTLMRLAKSRERQHTELFLAGSGPTDQREIAPPQQVYQLSLDDVAAGRGMEAARAVGWQYVVIEDREPVEAVETTLGGGGEPVRFSHVNRGPALKGFEEAIQVATSLGVVQTSDFELRCMRIPALYVSALWLKDVVADADQIIPMQPTFPPLQVNRPYTVQEFLALLREPAVRLLEFSGSSAVPVGAHQ